MQDELKGLGVTSDELKGVTSGVAIQDELKGDELGVLSYIRYSRGCIRWTTRSTRRSTGIRSFSLH